MSIIASIIFLLFNSAKMIENDEEKTKELTYNQTRASINAKLIESGERDRLREMLQQKLIECGWRDQVKTHCKELVRKKGLDNINIDDLVAEMVPKSRKLVPNPIKKELLERIRTFLSENVDE